MVPGTAIGVLVGDLMFFAMALRLARRTGRHDTTAMPLGLDTPSTFGMVFFVLGPAFVQAKATLPVAAAAQHTWHIGICAILISGVFKLACAAGSGWIRRLVPRAGLLGSLTAIALVLISFLPLVEILRTPVVGLVALAIILSTLIGRVPLPGRIPGTLGRPGHRRRDVSSAAVGRLDADDGSRDRSGGGTVADRLADRVSPGVVACGLGYAAVPAGDPAVRAGHGRGRDRLHRECRGGGRRLQHDVTSSPSKRWRRWWPDSAAE